MKLTRNRRRPFPCGHKGFGQYCHRCQEAANLEHRAEQSKDKSSKEFLLERAKHLRQLPQARTAAAA